MYISKSKCYESGSCVIVTSEDYNFWDDEALKCFAEVLTKKHAQIGVDFEEELKKFRPSLEIDQVEDNVYNNKLTDVTDLLDEMLKEIKEHQ